VVSLLCRRVSRPYDRKVDDTRAENTQADDTDVEGAVDFPADLLQLQRELDAVRREFVRWRRGVRASSR
jgi:hypothetical protein